MGSFPWRGSFISEIQNLQIVFTFYASFYTQIKFSVTNFVNLNEFKVKWNSFDPIQIDGGFEAFVAKKSNTFKIEQAMTTEL